jgi:hypothetical protein
MTGEPADRERRRCQRARGVPVQHRRNLALPDSVIRGLQIQTDFDPITATRADIRIAAAANVPPAAPERVAPEIRDCVITGDCRHRSRHSSPCRTRW